ncbi:phosphotransferase [Micromonospora sp. M12]
MEVPGFRITGVISSGANGIVFAAEDSLDREVVIKVYPPRLDRGGDDSPYEKAWNEARKIASLKHEGLAAVYTFGQLSGANSWLSEEWPYCVMEYRSGIPLREALPLIADDLPFRRSALRQIFDVLEYAEARGVLHGDLHQGNVLVETWHRVGNVSVIDFGTSVFAGKPSSEERHARLLQQLTFKLMPELKESFVSTPRLRRRVGRQMLPTLAAALELHEFIYLRADSAQLRSPRELGGKLADAIDFNLDVLWARSRHKLAQTI